MGGRGSCRAVNLRLGRSLALPITARKKHPHLGDYFVDRDEPKAALGGCFYVSLFLAFGLFVFLPMFPLTNVIVGIGTVWGIVGVVMACRSVRGYGWIGAVTLSFFYALMVLIAWRHLLSRN